MTIQSAAQIFAIIVCTMYICIASCEKVTFHLAIAQYRPSNANVVQFDRKSERKTPTEQTKFALCTSLSNCLQQYRVYTGSSHCDQIYDKAKGKKKPIKIVCLGIWYAVDGFGKIDSTTVAAQINCESKQTK